MDLSNITINLHSSIRIAGSKVLYFDPFKIEEDSHDADIVFVTHEHYDHFDPESIEKIINENTIVVFPKTMEEIVRKEAGFVTPTFYEPGILTELAGLTVETVRAYNVGKQFHPKDKDWNGYIITMDGIRYYVAGDTDANDDNVKVRCDIALIPCGDTFTMDSKAAAEFAILLKPKAAIPTHYGSVVGKSEDGPNFKKYMDEANSGIQVELKL